MRFRLLSAGVLAAVLAISLVPLTAQTQGAKPAAAAPKAPAPVAAKPAVKFVPPRTVDGQPDLAGVWSYGTATPLERPGGQSKAEFTDEEELSAAAQRAQARNFDDRSGGAQADVGRAYNDFWWDYGKTLAGRQTSLVI